MAPTPPTRALIAASLAGLPLLALAWAAFKAHRNAASFKRRNPDTTVKVVALPFAVRFLLRLFNIKLFPRGGDFVDLKYDLFKDSKDDVLAYVTPKAVHLYLADPDLIREAATRPRDFPKPLFFYKLLDVFGRNIVTMEGEEWRAHRRIVAPSFSERNNMLVHEETIRSLETMFEAWDQKADAKHGGGTLIMAHDDTMQLALMIISGAAFGIRLEWEDQTDATSLPRNHKLSFQQALKQTTHNLPFYIITPKFLFNLPFSPFANVKLAIDEFRGYLNEIIEKAQNLDGDRESGRNLLLMLANASEDRVRMSRSELLGNAFIFLFAGHETTAGTINYAMANLALYPEMQDRLYAEAESVYGADRGAPTFKQIGDLHYATALGNETLRLYPPVISIPKWTAETPQRLGHLNLPPHTHIDFVAMAAHTNTRVWGADALVFNPDRFLGKDGKIASTNPRGFLPFSEGQRSCVGKRFAQIELAVALSVIASRFTIHLPDDVDRKRMLESYTLVTLRPKTPIRLIVKRR